jgi:hypothetical protein
MKPYVSSARSGSGGGRPSSAKSERITISIQSNETPSSKSSQDLTTGSWSSTPLSLPIPCLEDDSYLTEELSDYLNSIHTREQLDREINKVQKHMACVETIVYRAIMTRYEREQLTIQLGTIFRSLLYKKEAMRPGPPPPPTLKL